jgi:hypothetical protein
MWQTKNITFDTIFVYNNATDKSVAFPFNYKPFYQHISWHTSQTWEKLNFMVAENICCWHWHWPQNLDENHFN